MPEDKLPIPQFAAKIKAKYPEYKDVNDTLLVKRIVEKYPEYKESVDLSGLEEPVKKKETALPLGGKVGSSVGRLDVGAGITEIDDKGKPIGKALGKVSGITTPEQAKISRVNKAFGKIESFAGSREDFEEIYKQAPQEFDNLAKQVAPNVNKGEIDKFYTTEAARKDAYVDRVLQSYNQQKTKAQLESARRYRPVIESQFSTATIPLSNYTGKQYQLPQSEAQVSEILSDLNNEKEKLKTELTTNWNLSEVQTKAKELSEIEAAIRQNLTYQVGRMALERLSQNNPNVTSKDIGKEIFRVLHPDEYDLYEKVGGDKPVSFTVGTQRDTPVEAHALNEQMVQLGNEIKRMYGNETAIQDADIEEQTAKRKYTFQRQTQVKQKIAAILHERGLSPDKATEELKDKVVNKYLPDEDKEIWYNNNKVYNNVDLPSTGFAYSLKNAYYDTVKDAVGTVFGGLMPNRKKMRAAELLEGMSTSDVLGEDPQFKARLSQLKDKEKTQQLNDQEKQEKEQLEQFTDLRSKKQKIFDMAGSGIGQILGLGSISAFTGGLSSARTGLGALKSLVAPSGGRGGIMAASYLMSHENNAKEALRMFPNEKDALKRFFSTEFNTAIDMAVEQIFPEEQFLSGIAKKEVSKLITNLTAKNIASTLNDNAFKQLAKNIVGRSKKLLATPLQETAEEEIALSLKKTFEGIIAPDKSEGLTLKDVVETGEQAFWGSVLLGAPKGVFGYTNNKVPLTALWDAASSQDGYTKTKMTIERLKRDGELTEAEAKDRLDNLELGRNEYINNPILSGDMGGLDAGQKQNYFARILNEAILKKQADAVTDPNLKKQYEQQIKESEAIREKIYKGEIKVTPENEEVTKQEFEKKQKEQPTIDQDRVLGDEEVELTPEQKVLQQAIDNNEVDGMFLDMAKAAVADPQQAKQLLDEAKSQATGQVAGELGSARSGVEKAWGKSIADFVAPQGEAAGVSGSALKDATEHKRNIHDKFRKEFEGKGIPKEQIDGALALMEARAKSWASEEKGRNPDDWYSRIADVKSGEFVDGSGKQFQVEAYHGSPHDFDKFSASKIGTGEGAAAFGHGLYFTDLKGIAEEYARKLSNDSPTIDGKKIDDWFRDNDLKAPYSSNYWMPELLSESKSKEEALSKIDLRIKSQEGKIDGYNDILDDGESTQNERAGARRALEVLEKDLQVSYDLYNAVFRSKSFEPPTKGRNLYKVSLHEGKQPSEYNWLDWDKDLPKEKIDKIRKALLEYDLPDGYSWATDLNKNKNHVVHQVKDAKGNIVGEGIDKEEASKDAGIGKRFYPYFGEERRVAEFDKVFKRNSDGKYTTGAGFYHRLSELLGSDKAASDLLLKAGIDGVKYPAESIARGATSDNARGFNYVVFDDKAVTIKEKIQFQNQKGAVETLADGRKVIHALDAPDFSTMVHEVAHVFESDLTEAESKIVKDFGGSEAFARGFERYLRDGKAPTTELKTLFEKFKQWLTNIYKTLKGSPIEKRISPEIKQIFDRLLTEKKSSTEAATPTQETTPVSEPTTPPTTKAKELADKGIGKYEKKAREIADKIQKSELPDWLKADLPDGTKKAGAGYDQLKKALADAVIEMGRLLDKGVEYSQAIKQAVKELVSLQGEENRDTIEKGFEKYYTDQTQQQPPPPQTPKQEPKEVGIKHKETEAIRQRYGLPEYERAGSKTNAELEAEADRLISEGYDIEKLIKKIEDGTPPTGVENYILTKYIGNLEAKFAKDKSDETLKELKRLLDATDRIGSLQSEAFRTRKAMSPADDSLASFFIKEMDSLGVDELTQEQKDTITKEYEEIKATNNALQKKIVELERQMAEMEAKQKVSNEARRMVRGRKTKQQFNEERKKIIGNIREKLRKAKGETQATVVPYLKELIVIAPDVAKLVKNLVEEGVTNLADIVDNIHEYLKEEIDGIQKKDVVDLIAGVYDEKKPTRNELAKKLFDLKAGAKLLNRYAELVEGKEPASEKKKIQRNKELSDLRKKIKESDITKLSQVKEKYKTQIAELEQKIKDGDFSKPEPKKKIKLDKEGQQLRDKLIKLKQQRDARILLNQRVNETKKQRGLRLFAEVLNIPRTLMTIGDFSGLLRQGIFGISHPSMMANASKQMFKTAFSQKEYDRWFADLKEDPRFYAMKESKLSIADSLSHDLSEREEVFMSTLAEKIPIVGQTLTIKGKKVIPGLNIVKGSERSYTALLNKMRVDLFNYFADSMEARGLTIENAPKQYKAMAEYINNATGRSDFGKHLNRIAPILNSVFFSPRLIASRVNMLTYFMQPRFWKTLPKEARIDYFRSWASLLSIGLTILALAQAGGADVEDDPRSSDFGKIRSGDTRWDIWGGAQPYMRVFAQVVSGKRKSTNSGEIYELTGDDAFGETRAGVVSDFFRGKLAPVPASMVDVLSGRTTTGDKIVYEFETDGVKEVAIDNYIMERLLPMTITGTREAIKEKGASAILTVGVPSVFGVGTQTYGKPIKEVRDEVEYEGVKIKLTKEQYLKYRDLANKYINENVNKLKSLKEYQQIEDRDERLGIERAVKNYSVSKAEQEIIDLYEKTFKDTEELKDKAKEKKEKREDILEQIKD